MVVYILLKFFIILSLVFSGLMLQKRRVSSFGTTYYRYPFYLAVFPVCIVYTIVEGLRYGRAADYFSYHDTFIGLRYIDYEPLFAVFVKLLNIIDAPFYLGFLICSFVLILCGGLLIKEIRFLGLFVLPLFYLDTISQSSNLVRMYVALSLILLALKYLIQNRNNRVIIYLCLAFLTHYSSIILFPFIFLFNKYDNLFKNRYIITILFLILNLSTVGVEFIADRLPSLKIFGLYLNYLDSANVWILGEGIEKVKNDFSVFYYTRSYLTPLCVIWFGHKYIKKYKSYKYGIFYNLYVIGALFMPTALTLPTEVFYRLCLYFLSFKFFVLSFIFYEKFNKLSKFNLLSVAIINIVFLDSIYLLFKTIFVYSSELGNQFVWDIITD